MEVSLPPSPKFRLSFTDFKVGRFAAQTQAHVVPELYSANAPASLTVPQCPVIQRSLPALLLECRDNDVMF